MIKIYEVMAIHKGIPLFLLEHIDRFHNSIKQYKDIDKQNLLNIFLQLIKDEDLIETGFNIKIAYSEDFSITKIKSRKPSNDSYIQGVKCELFNGERDTPLVKKENTKLQSITSDICSKNGLYDVLLVNHLEEITEGSRSNFLIIIGNTLITSPKGDALEGVTRKKVFEICREQKLQIIERKIHIDDLEKADSLIITGTSPEILPVKSCGRYNFKVRSPILDLLIKEFKIKKDKDYTLNRGYFESD